MDTPLLKRAYNLGLKAVPNFTILSLEQIEFYEQNLNRIPLALARGFTIDSKPEPIPEPPLDFIIKVDRSVKLRYPNWVKEVMHPELENTGPSQYGLQKLDLWLHGYQKKGIVDGYTIYDYLKKNKALESCLDLADLLAIQEKGIKIFYKLFGYKKVFGWKSVVQDYSLYLKVPFLFKQKGGKVVLGWNWLGYPWDLLHPALRFSK